MATLLEICQNVADVAGLPRPVSVAASTDAIARQMLQLANETLEDLYKMNWPVIMADTTFYTVVGQESYSLPTNYGRSITDTAYEATQYYDLRMSMTPSEWQRSQNALPSQIGRYRARITGWPVKIHIWPLPRSVEKIAYQYVNKLTVIDPDTGTETAAVFTKDDQYCKFEDELMRKGVKWRIKKERGFDYQEDFNEYEFAKATLLGQQMGLASIPVAQRRLIDIPEIPTGYTPEYGFGV